MLFIAEKQQKAILNVFFKFINCKRIIKSNLCDYNDPYILRGDITVVDTPSIQVVFRMVHHLLNIS